MEEEYPTFNACLREPFSMIVAGPSNSGKTTFVHNLLKNYDRLGEKKLDYIIWCYGQTPPEKKDFMEKKNIVFINGIPSSFDKYLKPELNGLVILDDLMKECSNNTEIAKLFTQTSHHESINVIYISQNYFSEGKERQTVNRNATYLVIFNSPLDQTIPQSLGRKLLPKNQKTFINIFNEATKKPHSYLLIDGHQKTPREYRFRSNIFDTGQEVYIPNKA